MSSLQGRKAAQRGGSYAGSGYITYAERDRICRRVITAGVPFANRKAYRDGLEKRLIEWRRNGGES